VDDLHGRAELSQLRRVGHGHALKHERALRGNVGRGGTQLLGACDRLPVLGEARLALGDHAVVQPAHLLERRLV
jgi:hypothetical protein